MNAYPHLPPPCPVLGALARSEYLTKRCRCVNERAEMEQVYEMAALRSSPRARTAATSDASDANSGISPFFVRISSYFASVLLRRPTEHGREAVSPAVHRRARAAVLETGQRRREAMQAAHYPWADRLQCSTLLRVRLRQSMAQSHAALPLDHAAAPLATVHWRQ